MRWISGRDMKQAMLVTLLGLGVPGLASAQVSARVYVANRQAATVSVIDARTATVVAPTPPPAVCRNLPCRNL
jgi:DNA-binding beta-propeller fold protein YncE